jgi:hypothetical protein
MASRLTERRFLWPEHVELLSKKFAAVAMGEIPRLMVFMPPQHSKSTIVSEWGPTWYLGNFPRKRVILASYAAEFAASWGRKVRNNLLEFGGQFGLRLADDSKAASEWSTHAGGGMLTAGMGGGITGRPADLMIIDDPFKNSEQAGSRLYRDSVWDTWQSAAVTRLQPGAGVIVMHTRWHEDDLAGRLLAAPDASRWEVLCLPALAGPDDPLGRAPGDALWPERFSTDDLAVRRQEVGSYFWNALYQQDPPSLTGHALYGSFDPAKNIDSTVELLDGLPLQMAVDFNRNPGMHAILGQHFPGNDELTSRYVLHEPRMHIKGMIAKFAKLLQTELRAMRFPMIEVYGDATGRITQMSDGQSSWDVLIAEMKHHGIPHRMIVPSRNPGVLDRVNTVNAAFAAPDGRVRYRIHPECEALIQDYKNMKADEFGEEDKHDQLLSHASSADGYRVCMLMPINVRLMRFEQSDFLVSR